MIEKSIKFYVNQVNQEENIKQKLITARPKGAGLVIGLLYLLAVGIVAYGVSLFTGGEMQATQDDCYIILQRNFPAPDGMIALCAVICAEGLRRGKEWEENSILRRSPRTFYTQNEKYSRTPFDLTDRKKLILTSSYQSLIR